MDGCPRKHSCTFNRASASTFHHLHFLLITLVFYSRYLLLNSHFAQLANSRSLPLFHFHSSNHSIHEATSIPSSRLPYSSPAHTYSPPRTMYNNLTLASTTTTLSTSTLPAITPLPPRPPLSSSPPFHCNPFPFPSPHLYLNQFHPSHPI